MFSCLIRDVQKEELVKFKRKYFKNWYEFWEFIIGELKFFEDKLPKKQEQEQEETNNEVI